MNGRTDSRAQTALVSCIVVFAVLPDAIKKMVMFASSAVESREHVLGSKKLVNLWCEGGIILKIG